MISGWWAVSAAANVAVLFAPVAQRYPTAVNPDHTSVTVLGG